MSEAVPDAFTVTKTLVEDEAGGLFRGVRNRDGVPVMVKFVRGDARVSREAEHLRHEHEILSGLEGSWVPKPYGLDRQGGQLRLVLADFDGELLSALFNGPLEPGRFLGLAVELTAAVLELHRQGIVHRDLRPGNVLLDPRSGALKLIGLGMASRRSDVPVTAVRRPVVEGSPAYMSPEQTGYTNRRVDSRSDLYSLGIMLYELLTGQLPFQAGDPLEWAHCHIARQPRPPGQIVPTIPEGLAEVVLKLLAKQPEERYQSASGLLSDLERCREEWTAEGAVCAFPLGTRDVCDRLLIPSRLYGREREAALLAASLERIRGTGGRELVLVSGYSGMGKSSLVQELRGPVMEARGYFVTGKYDQYQRDVPYATLVQACQGLLQQILTESQERVRTWAAALRTALGSNASLIVELVPQLELLIGPQPPAAVLPPGEAQQRLHLVFGRFLGVFARPEHPLVLFVDDLQWLDPASLALTTSLLTSPDLEALLLIAAYRDNEVGPAHPLTSTLEKLRRSEVHLHELVLAPLPPSALTHFVADTLRRPVTAVEPLAGLIREKTQGNPFFAIHFLTALHREGLLLHDPVDGGWRWDLSAIRRQGFTDNVVELMLGRLRRLSAAARDVLAQAACVGSTVDAATLAPLTGHPQDQLHEILREALDHGLVSRLDGRYTFLHDRVQEAAYALLEPEQRPAQHLRIGRALLARTSRDRLAERVFEIVGQLNQGAGLITSADERQRLAELNLVAGRRAKATCAFASALTYLAAGMALLDAAAWDSCHDLVLALHVERAECEYLVGNFACAEQLLTVALDHARSPLDQGSVYRLQQRLYQLSGRWAEALSTTLRALSLFGVSLPNDQEAVSAATDAEIQRIYDTLRDRRIADLAEAPLSDDPRTRAFIGLLEEAMPLIFCTRPPLWPLVTARGVNVCLERGHAEESPFVYSCYAMVLMGVRRDLRAAHEFSEMALRLNERLPSAAAWRGKLLLHHGALITIWSRHFATGLPLLDQAFDACLESGDLLHANYITYNMIWLHWENSDRLEEVAALAHRLAAFALQTNNDVVHQVDRLLEQFVLSLQGRTLSLTDFGDADTDFDEADCVAAIERADFGLGLALYYIAKQVACFHAGRLAEALDWAERMAPVLIQVAAFSAEATYHFYRALTLTALHAQADRQQHCELGQGLQEPVERLRFWAESCPDNFAHRYALVRAEVAGIEGRDTEALRLYGQAMDAAQRNGFVHHEGLAAELASRFCHSRGLDWIAGAFLRRARDCYARWGAEGLVRRLDQRNPGMVELPVLVPTARLSAQAEQFDLLSVVKASQAISREIVLPRLQETLIRLALEQAGAQRGCLLLADGESLSVHARTETEGDRTRVEVLPEASMPDGTLPMSLIHYVARSGETVVVADAASDGRYSGDGYFSSRGTRSALGVPIIRQGRLTGVLYLENDLVSGAFIDSKLAALELLAAQAAISLETARLYAEVQQENAERRRVEAEVRQLNRGLEQRVLDRTAELQATNARLEAINEDLTAFAYSASHDLRAPLRQIHGFVEILMEEHGSHLDAEAGQLLARVLASSERMGRLIDDLLSFSRMGRQGLSRQRVDLSALVHEVVRDAEPELSGREVRWQIAELPVVVGDPAMLRVVLVNLVSNALKFTRSREPAEIEIGVTEHAKAWLFSVRDNGVGFDRRYVDKMFGVFQRLHRDAEFEGTGIGLATVRRIIERHGGRTWADGDVDQGATAYFTLPRAGPSETPPPAGPEARPRRG